MRQLEAFRAVAQTGSVTRAAQILNISQPAVSRLISDFTKSVEFNLFTRKGGALVPTSEARYMLVEVNRVIEGVQHLEDLSRDLTERTAGHLRIACLPGFATSHLPNILARFLTSRPGVTATLEPDRPDRILEWIIGEQYDCGITGEFAGHPAIDSQDIPLRTACILPKGHALAAKTSISPQDLEHEKFIHTRLESPFHTRLSRAFADCGAQINTWIEVRQFTAACTIVAQGHGVSVVSSLDAEQFRDRNIEIKPFVPDVHHWLSIVRPVSGTGSLLVLDFLEMFMTSLDPFIAKGVPRKRP